MKNLMILVFGLVLCFVVPAHAQSDLYVCPMHPEVQSSKPSKCPKCGMALVKKKQPAKPKPAPKKQDPPLSAEKKTLIIDWATKTRDSLEVKN